MKLMTLNSLVSTSSSNYFILFLLIFYELINTIIERRKVCHACLEICKNLHKGY